MDHSVINPIADMDLDENDEKKLYEIADEDGGFKSLKDPSYVINSTTTPTSCWTKLGPIATFILILLAILILILQAVTVHQIITNPESSGDIGATDARTGDTADSPTTLNFSCFCNCNESKELLKELIAMLNTSLLLSEMQSTQIQNTTDILEENLDTTQDASSRLLGVIGSLANVEDNTVNTDGTVNDILLKVETVLRLQNQSLQDTEFKSCQDIRDAQPDSPSGYYHIHSQIVYCEMGELCGSEGGWTRIAYLDMSDSTVNCPDGFALLQSGGVRACGRPTSGDGSCASVKFPSNGISYTEVCGRVYGYQFGSPDAVDTIISNPVHHNDVNSIYVDGISVTRGYPRQHIWTFMSGLFDSTAAAWNCPCNSPPGTQGVQSFIGNDYFCESGISGPHWGATLYTGDPLWDGEGCGSQESDCCAAPGLPWFNQTVNATTDYLELRVCCDQTTWDEDVPVGYYEIYIK